MALVYSGLGGVMSFLACGQIVVLAAIVASLLMADSRSNGCGRRRRVLAATGTAVCSTSR